MNDLSSTVKHVMQLDNKSCRGETSVVNSRNEHAKLFADAVISEIKAEMGRQDISSRGLGRLIGKSSQYMSTRLDGGNPRTGERVPLGINDLSAIADALAVPLLELVARAESTLEQRPVASLDAQRDKRATDCPPIEDHEGDEGDWDAFTDPTTLRQSDYTRAAHEAIDDDGSDDNN